MLQCKYKIRNSKEAYKRAKGKKQTEGSPVFPTYAELRCWDIEMSWKSRSSNKLELLIEKLKQIANESPTFGKESEDREIGENMRIMSISSRPIFSVNFHVPIFHHVAVSFPHVRCSRQVPSYFAFER